MPEIDPEHPSALDLTHSVLRAPSPIHVEYLKNMQVGGSFTLSLLCNGRLWGMLACHHRTPYFVDFASREAAELFAMAASAQLSAWETRDKQDAVQQMKLVKQWLQNAVDNGEDPTDVLVEKSNLLIELTSSAGVAIVRKDEIIRLGNCPQEEEVAKLVEQIKNFCLPIYTVRNITHVMPSASCASGHCAGVMCVKVTRRFEDEYIMWFRPEMIEEVTWGGDPRKNVRASDGRIHPRKSFAAWKETVRNTSAPWTILTTTFAAQLGQAITEAERTTTQ
jgi:chemotaxis family two-component system sensor kinase Cph1